MKKVLTGMFLLLLLAGVALGPGYLLYCNHFSGTVVAEPEIFSLDISPVAVKGVTKRVVSGAGNPIDPITIALTPDMNPVSVLLTGRYVRPRAGRKRTEYSVALKRDDSTIWEDSITVTGKSSDKKNKKKLSLGNVKIGKMDLDSFSLHVNTFNVPESGDYELRVSHKGSPALNHVVDMNAKIRRNTTIANRTVGLSGCAALGIGLVGLVVIGIVSKNTQQG